MRLGGTVRGETGSRSISMRALATAAAVVCTATVSWSVLAASPAFAARASATLQLSPSRGAGNATFAATFKVNGANNQCPGGQVDFAFDSQPVATAAIDPFSCTASAAMQVPLGAPPGAHKVKGTLTGGSTSASASATFTVDQGPPTQPSSSNTQPSSSAATTPTVPTWSNTITPTTPWNPPPFAPQQLNTSFGPCDTQGAHAKNPAGDVLVVPSYAAGAHPAAVGSTLVNEPLTGSLPIASVGPAGMLPPRLGVDPYQSLEVLEPIDPVVSPKLRLAAAAGSPFGCVQVEAFGPPGSGYGYLVYALKNALVISAQDVNADGSPFVPPSPTTPSPSAAGKGPAPTPAPAPKPKYERLVLGYSSVSWEWQEAAGGDKAPLHRGAGSVQPAPPAPPLSYSNLAFAFGGLVAATVALMFAYHSRRRELLRRVRRPGHAA